MSDNLIEDDDVERVLTDAHTQEAGTATKPVPLQSHSERREAEWRADVEANQAKYKAQQQALDKELGPEITFLNSFLWQIEGSLKNAARTLKSAAISLEICKGNIFYDGDRWTWDTENPIPPESDERKNLAEMFRSAARKLTELGLKVRSGSVDPVMRHRLEEYGFLAKGGSHGRWMCDGLAEELERIAREIE
ncbi:MAG TPA: hypothetical protein VN893_22495 [Bryobacteraceae bacterium]|nr:hypothetical protein [Bryobacteraceae bacterium]